MTNVWIRTATLNDHVWYAFKVDAPGVSEYVTWAEFAKWVGDPVEAMHILRREFLGYTLYETHRHIHIPERDAALRFGVWLFHWFEKDRLTVSSKFLGQPLEEVLKLECAKHIYMDYVSLGDMDMIRLVKEIASDARRVRDCSDSLLEGEV